MAARPGANDLIDGNMYVNQMPPPDGSKDLLVLWSTGLRYALLAAGLGYVAVVMTYAKTGVVGVVVLLVVVGMLAKRLVHTRQDEREREAWQALLHEGQPPVEIPHSEPNPTTARKSGNV
jgi:hypothetical protein